MKTLDTRPVASATSSAKIETNLRPDTAHGARVLHITQPKGASQRFSQTLTRAWLITRPRLGLLHQHDPRPLRALPTPDETPSALPLPSIGIVTPSYQQGGYIEHTIRSVLDQNYPALQYYVQDGGSTDETVDVLKKYEHALLGWVSEKDEGQSEAINRGFRPIDSEIMAYLNSDDLLLPGALRIVGEFFARNPDVDVVYGDRLIIDENGDEIGNWRLPPHNGKVLSWADYVPQETLFWRRSAWEAAGGSIDESFRFAMDWDLLVRLRDSGARFRHLPRFLGAFRVHSSQKTSSVITSTGQMEMSRIRQRILGYEPDYLQIWTAVAPYLLTHMAIDIAHRGRNRVRSWFRQSRKAS